MTRNDVIIMSLPKTMENAKGLDKSYPKCKFYQFENFCQKLWAFRDGPLFFSGGTFSTKKISASCSWLKNIVCFKVMKGRICLQSKEKFFEIH